MEQKGLDFGSEEKKPEAPRPAPRAAAVERRAFTVTQLTERIRGALEAEFFDVWVEGEVSNLRLAASGHWYFSLKDENAQIQAVLWKSAARLVRFKPRDGLKVLARGSLGVFAPRGEYRLSVEVLEPLGKGSLQQAFEELKERLEKEGLFSAARKRPLPSLPRRIAIVTSPVGAVIQDILRVLQQRYANLEVLIYPARVQGPEAAAEIVQGLRALGKVQGLDVVIVARGGGSLEDLWPFNEERVARALAACAVPTISAVGHETDFTIADFVADLRAPTPSAAAERVIEAKTDISARIDHLRARLAASARLRMTRVRARVSGLTSHRVFTAERGRLRSQAQRVDDLARRADTGLMRQVERARERLRRGRERAEAFRWERQLAARRDRVAHGSARLTALARTGLAARRAALGRCAAQLESLSPLSVLSRGYALVWDARGRLLRDTAAVATGDELSIRVHAGRLRAAVTAREPA